MSTIPGVAASSSTSEARSIEARASDGLALRGHWWSCTAPRGAVVVAHGLGEHGGAYAHVARALGEALELDVVAIDFRGHGMSDGRRGLVQRYEQLIDDLECAVRWTAERRPGVPKFVLGHSNGGQVALRWALRNGPQTAGDCPDFAQSAEQNGTVPLSVAVSGPSLNSNVSIEGLIVSDPALRLALPVSPFKIRLGKLLLKYASWITLGDKLRADLLTRDPEFQKLHRTDPLRHNRISAPLFFGMVDGGPLLLQRAPELQTPLLLLLGGQDPVIDPAFTREFFDRVGAADKTLMFYPKMLHEPLNELGKEQVFADVVRWIGPRLGN